MKSSPFDNLPPLSQEEALEILSRPVNNLHLVSDYYKAVFHLEKFPGDITENALIKLIKSKSQHQSIVIARRKAVEVLARLDCYKSIPIISDCLNSNDPYLIENAAWALCELKCENKKIHDQMIDLLDSPGQYLRVLIQSLSRLGVVKAYPKIKLILSTTTSSILRGACLAALYRLDGQKEQLYELEKYLFVSSQNDRHCAIQDVIDAERYDMLPVLVKSPVAPFFKIRAINELWPKNTISYKNINIINILDDILNGNPKSIQIVHSYDKAPTDEFLFQELFGTDFSRCYLALQTLLSRKTEKIKHNMIEYLPRANKDYGALYFFILLFRYAFLNEASLKDHILESIDNALSKKWPDFIKFKPAAILLAMKLDPVKFKSEIINWLDPVSTPYWACRYASLMTAKSFLPSKESDYILREIYATSKKDENWFVRIKARDILSCKDYV